MSDSRRRTSRRSRRELLIGALAVLVSAAVAVVVGSMVDTAESRFAGSTDNRGSLLEAGEVQLELVTDTPDEAGGFLERSELAIDATNVLPGQTIQRCIVVGYSGSVSDVDLHLFARNDSADLTGDDLSPFIETTIDVGGGFDPDCGDFTLPPIDPGSWSGTLETLGEQVDSFAAGIPVLVDAPSESTATVRVRLTLANDNRAQGLSTLFWLIFEVRP